MSSPEQQSVSAANWAFAREIRSSIQRWISELRTWRMHRQGCRQSRAFLNDDSLRLHLGCGKVYKKGFINIDAYKADLCTPDLLLDLRHPLPFLDNCCSEIYSEHLFEHIPYPTAATSFLKEMKRLLSANGILSIGVPDPEPVLQDYLANRNSPYFDYFFSDPSVTRHLLTRMEGVNWLFRQGGEHQFIYDYPSLERMLLETGFSRIKRRDFDASRDSPIRRFGTIYVDAWK